MRIDDENRKLTESVDIFSKAMLTVMKNISKTDMDYIALRSLEVVPYPDSKKGYYNLNTTKMYDLLVNLIDSRFWSYKKDGKL